MTAQSKKCVSVGARLLGMQVRIPPGAQMAISWGCVVYFQVEVSATGRSLVQRNPTDCGMSECGLET